MNEVSLIADCSACAALCCVGPAFDKSAEFAIDKPAATPCLNLAADFRCSIHDRLAGSGFIGCVRFDCLGAGQRVVQYMFGGRTWRDTPEIAAEMFESFRIMRDVHVWLSLLDTAGGLALSPPQQTERRALIAALCPDEEWSPAGLAQLEAAGMAARVQGFLASLRNVVTGVPPRR